MLSVSLLSVDYVCGFINKADESVMIVNLDDCDTCPLLGFVPESDRVPIQLRRTTFVVYNMTRSRAFYEDGLGMVPIYGKKIMKIQFLQI